MNKFSEVMKKYSDEILIDLFINHKDEYTPEALEAMEEELKSRGLENRVVTHQQENESIYDVAIREIRNMEYNASKLK